jgi:hypothetical protein
MPCPPSLVSPKKAPTLNGYYPNSYSGASFTGFLQPENSDPPEITLVYTKGGKSDRFVGVGINVQLEE